MFIYVLVTGIAHAGDWSIEKDPWELRAAGPYAAPVHLTPRHLIDECWPGTNANSYGEATDSSSACLYDDLLEEIVSDHPNFTCLTDLHVASPLVGSEDLISISLQFDPGESGNWTDWLNGSEWPSEVSCSRAFGPYTHEYIIPIEDSNLRFYVDLPVVETETSWGSTINMNIPAVFAGDVRIKYLRIPGGTYTGPSAEGIDPLRTTTSVPTDVEGTGCHIYPDDETGNTYLVVGIEHGIPNGTAVCDATRNGNARTMTINYTSL